MVPGLVKAYSTAELALAAGMSTVPVKPGVVAHFPTPREGFTVTRLRNRADRSRKYGRMEWFVLLGMVPQKAIKVTSQEAIDLAIAIIRQAAEDLCAPPMRQDPPPDLRGSELKQWLRLARSRVRRVEAAREDAERFFWSPWFEDLCDAMDADHEVIREQVYERRDQG